MKTVFKKLAGSRGFTLAETLICVLILLMVCGIVGAAMPAASAAYTKAVDAANAQVLLSTGISTLRNELSTAADVTISADNKSVSYRSGSTGSWSEIYKDDSGIYVKTWYGYNKSGTPVVRELVSRAASTANLRLTYDSFASSADGKVLDIEGLAVYMKSGAASETEIVNRGSTEIRLVAGKVETTASETEPPESTDPPEPTDPPETTEP